MSESARGEGGRVWTYKDGKPWYFLEEKYPAYGNLVPRDIATREIFDVCVNQHLGINGQNVVYLDVSHIPASVLNAKLEGILDIYQKFVGDDPRKVPMRVAPSVHYSMGGLWVGLDQQTNIPGLFAAGECDYAQHGANRLGANSLLSAVFAGMTAGPNAAAYAKGLPEGQNIPQSVYEAAAAKDESDYRSILKLDGTENAYRLHQEMGELMTKIVTVVRNNADLAETLVKLEEIDERLSRIGVQDKATWSNANVPFIRQLYGMVDLAMVITKGALERNESRGSHFKPEFPDRNDEEWLKTTIARYDIASRSPVLSYEKVDTSLIAPRKRDYTKAH